MDGTITINISDYIDESQIRDIIAEELRSAIKQDAERVLSNMSYQVLFGAVDKALEGESAEIIKAQVLKKIESGITDYAVFHKSYYDCKDISEGQRIVNECVQQNRALIETYVMGALNKHDYTKTVDEGIGEDFIYTLMKVIERGSRNR